MTKIQPPPFRESMLKGGLFTKVWQKWLNLLFKKVQKTESLESLVYGDGLDIDDPTNSAQQFKKLFGLMDANPDIAPLANEIVKLQVQDSINRQTVENDFSKRIKQIEKNLQMFPDLSKKEDGKKDNEKINQYVQPDNTLKSSLIKNVLNSWALTPDSAKKAEVPAGLIALWSGSVATIPATWALCNGSNGTPDLRNNFVVGAGSTYNPGDNGGLSIAQLEAFAILETNMPTHNHNIATDGSHDGHESASDGATAGTDFNAISSSGNILGGHDHGDTGNSGDGTTMDIAPPYYALAYIMKL